VARAALGPAEVGHASADAGEFTAVRRWIRRPDRVAEDPFGNRTVRANMHTARNRDDDVGPSGPEDPELFLLSLRARGVRPWPCWRFFDALHPRQRHQRRLLRSVLRRPSRSTGARRGRPPAVRRAPVAGLQRRRLGMRPHAARVWTAPVANDRGLRQRPRRAGRRHPKQRSPLACGGPRGGGAAPAAGPPAARPAASGVGGAHGRAAGRTPAENPAGSVLRASSSSLPNAARRRSCCRRSASATLRSPPCRARPTR